MPSAASNIQGDQSGAVVQRQPSQREAFCTEIREEKVRDLVLATLAMLGGGVIIGLSFAGIIDTKYWFLGAIVAGVGGAMVFSKNADWTTTRKVAFIAGVILFAAGVATLGVGVHDTSWGYAGVGIGFTLIALVAALKYRAEKERQDRKLQGPGYRALLS